jgi:hypothetical protein
MHSTISVLVSSGGASCRRACASAYFMACQGVYVLSCCRFFFLSVEHDLSHKTTVQHFLEQEDRPSFFLNGLTIIYVCTWIPDDRLSPSIQFTTSTPATTTPMACEEGSIANNRTSSTHAVRATRAVSPGTGTVAVPSPGNARAIAARKGRPPPCLRGAAGR